MPTASNGFIAATSRKPGSATTRPEPRDVQLALAHHGDQHVERLLRHPVELLDVQQRAVAHRGDERAVDEHVGVVALGEHARRVEVADEPRRRQLGVALDELEADAELVGDGAQQRRLAGARRTLDEDVAAGVERGEDELELAPAAPTSRPLRRGARRRRRRASRHARLRHTP